MPAYLASEMSFAINRALSFRGRAKQPLFDSYAFAAQLARPRRRVNASQTESACDCVFLQAERHSAIHATLKLLCVKESCLDSVAIEYPSLERVHSLTTSVSTALRRQYCAGHHWRYVPATPKAGL